MNDALSGDSTDLFSPADRAKIEALTEDPGARVGYEISKGMLIWSDELPRDLPKEAFDRLVMLVSYRSMMYRPQDDQASGHGPPRAWLAACRTVWEKAQASGLRWIGFAPSRTDPANLAKLLELEQDDL